MLSAFDKEKLLDKIQDELLQAKREIERTGENAEYLRLAHELINQSRGWK